MKERNKRGECNDVTRDITNVGVSTGSAQKRIGPLLDRSLIRYVKTKSLVGRPYASYPLCSQKVYFVHKKW